MSIRLQAEQRRLFGFEVPSNGELVSLQMASAGVSTRCLVLGLGRPAQWEPLLRVWEDVQSALSLPPPAIAVNGVDGYQLWFSLAEAVPVYEARRFLEMIAARHLADVGYSFVGCVPAIDGTRGLIEAGLSPVPAWQPVSGRWSAFVSQDLARIFEPEPWLEREPSPDAQADLLSRLQPASVLAFERALVLLACDDKVTAATPAAVDPAHSVADASHESADPRAFLLSVMNDASVDMHIRVDAAKALLPHTA